MLAVNFDLFSIYSVVNVEGVGL